MKFWHEWSDYKPDMFFCFGSNDLGIHGAGAALYAKRNCGAMQYTVDSTNANTLRLEEQIDMIKAYLEKEKSE